MYSIVLVLFNLTPNLSPAMSALFLPNHSSETSRIFLIWHVYICGRDKLDLEPADFSKLSNHQDCCQDCSTARYCVPRGTRVGVEEAKTEETGTVEPEPELEASVSVASCQPCRHCLPTCGQECLPPPSYTRTIPDQLGQPAGAPVEGAGGSHHQVLLPEQDETANDFVRIRIGFNSSIDIIYFSLNL